ncbi:MAG: dTMP kinase [bacterium]|nr:dTMP kinase [bacterium]
MIVEPLKFSPKEKPKFIVLEGLNGAGKTTLQAEMVKFLTSRGIKTKATREPGATEIGKSLRSLVLGAKKGEISELAEMFIFAADRAQHADKVIRPLINVGQVVISDRYFYSTLAFQGYGRQLGEELVWSINKIAIDGVIPDLVILLDIDPMAGLERNKGSSGSTPLKDGPDSFENEELAFHNRIRLGFLSLAKTRPEPFFVIDATQDRKDVWNSVQEVLSRVYE